MAPSLVLVAWPVPSRRCDAGLLAFKFSMASLCMMCRRIISSCLFLTACVQRSTDAACESLLQPIVCSQLVSSLQPTARTSFANAPGLQHVELHVSGRVRHKSAHSHTAVQAMPILRPVQAISPSHVCSLHQNMFMFIASTIS